MKHKICHPIPIAMGLPNKLLVGTRHSVLRALATAAFLLWVNNIYAQPSPDEDDRVLKSCLKLEKLSTEEGLMRMMSADIGLRLPVKFHNGSIQVDRSEYGGHAFVLEPLESSDGGMEIMFGFPGGGPRNAVYVFKGKVTIQIFNKPDATKYVFEGNKEDPLVFLLPSRPLKAGDKTFEMPGALTYIKGKGTVVGDGGELVKLPCAIGSHQRGNSSKRP